MRVSDPISDMFIRLKNASAAGLRYATVPASNLKIELTRILEQEGFIRGFRLIRNDKQGVIKVALKYTEKGDPVIRELSRVSRPGCRVYKRVDKLAHVKNGLGFYILSTSKGIMTDAQAKAQRLGGEVVGRIW